MSLVINHNDPASVAKAEAYLAAVTAAIRAQTDAATAAAEAAAAERELELARLSDETGLSITVLERLARL